MRILVFSYSLSNAGAAQSSTQIRVVMVRLLSPWYAPSLFEKFNIEPVTGSPLSFAVPTMCFSISLRLLFVPTALKQTERVFLINPVMSWSGTIAQLREDSNMRGVTSSPSAVFSGRLFSRSLAERRTSGKLRASSLLLLLIPSLL